MGFDFQKSLSIYLILVFALLLMPDRSWAGPVHDGWDDARPVRWTEKPVVRGDASHLRSRNSSQKDTVTPAKAEVLLATIPGKAFDWAPLWHNDGLGGCRIMARGVFTDLSGCWFAERIGEVPGPYSTLFVTGNSYTGKISGGRLVEGRLVSAAVWNKDNAGWFAVIEPQDEDSRQELLFIPFAHDEQLRSIQFAGSIKAITTIPDGSLWVADSDGRVWHSVDIFRGWSLEIAGTLPSGDIYLAPAADGRSVFAAAGGELRIFNRNGREISRADAVPAGIQHITAASSTSALLIDNDGNLFIFAGGSIRFLDEFARTAVWLPEKESYLVALRRKDFLQLVDRDGEFLSAGGKSKPGVPEFILPLPGEESMLVTVTGKFSRVTPTKRNFKFAPIFGSDK